MELVRRTIRMTRQKGKAVSQITLDDDYNISETMPDVNLIIQEKCRDILIAQRIKELAEIENKVRNLAAHTIVAVTPEWIKERTGKNIDEIMWLLRYICEKVKINLKKEIWNSYDNMNSNIISELERT